LREFPVYSIDHIDKFSITSPTRRRMVDPATARDGPQGPAAKGRGILVVASGA
jgi:hypothetical protein